MKIEKIFVTIKKFGDESYDYEGYKINTCGSEKESLAKIVIDERPSVSYNIRMKKIGREPLRVEDFHSLEKGKVNFDNMSDFRLVSKATFLKYINYINNPLAANYRQVMDDFE